MKDDDALVTTINIFIYISLFASAIYFVCESWAMFEQHVTEDIFNGLKVDFFVYDKN